MRTILILGTILALAIPVGADHCATYTTSAPEVDTGTLGDDARYYVDTEFPCPQCHVTLWIYQEANGLDGMQRGDEVVDDTCHSMILADEIIF
jgi:hypothetical protein